MVNATPANSRVYLLSSRRRSMFSNEWETTIRICGLYLPFSPSSDHDGIWRIVYFIALVYNLIIIIIVHYKKAEFSNAVIHLYILLVVSQ